MSYAPTLSVIIPAFNAEVTIKQCIESTLTQSKCDIEVIVVDDGSTDLTPAICDDIANKDQRIKVIHQENKGRTAAREAGVLQASAEWVCFLDADDTLSSDSLQLLYSMVAEGTDIVFGNGYTLKGEDRTTIPLEDFRHLAVKGEGTIGVPWGSLYRRSVLSHYLFDLSRDIYMGEDYIFWLRLIFTTSKPVNVVYQKVYDKGPDTTSSAFKWTADYAQTIHALRMQSIPKEKHHLYMHETIEDRIANLMAVTMFQPGNVWKKSPFYLDLLRDMHTCHYRFTLKQRIFLSLPSPRLRQAYSRLSNLIHR